MGITFTDGTITTTAAYQTIVNVTADEHFALWIFMHNMQAGDTIDIKIEVLDQNTSTLRIYDIISKSGVQASPAYYIPWLPARQYKVSIIRTAGTDRVFTWLRAEVI